MVHDRPGRTLFVSTGRDPGSPGAAGIGAAADAAAETLGRVDGPPFLQRSTIRRRSNIFTSPSWNTSTRSCVARSASGTPRARSSLTWSSASIACCGPNSAGEQGLADTNVWVLDPCCGTGSYVVEVLRRIRRTLEEQGLGDLVGERLKRAAMTRVAGSRS